ncbi:MAG: bacillithiol biosynthesis BshC, partial [Ignavibacteriae bacterium]
MLPPEFYMYFLLRLWLGLLALALFLLLFTTTDKAAAASASRITARITPGITEGITPGITEGNTSETSSMTSSTTSLSTNSSTNSSTSSSTSSTTHWSSTHDRIPVWQRQFSATELEAVDAALAWLDGQHADAVKTALTSIYHSMHSWTNAFLAILQPYLADWGVLVIRGSHVIDTGLHGPILERDLLGGGDLERAMEVRTDDLVADGYHAQATIGGVSFFMTVDGERHKVLRDGDNYRVNDVLITAADLHERARTSPSDFTPSVLARPLVQDAVLPTIATVLGPGEIAYQAQTTPAYALCGIPQPLVMPRHMACILDHRTERNLSKYGRPAEWFFRSWEEIEREVGDELQQRANVPEVDATAIAAFTQPWLDAAAAIDPTLEKTVVSATVGMQSSLEALTGKLRAAVKRKNGETLERVRGLWASIYPDATMNERVFPLALWQSRLGDDALRI